MASRLNTDYARPVGIGIAVQYVQAGSRLFKRVVTSKRRKVVLRYT